MPIINFFGKIKNDLKGNKLHNELGERVSPNTLVLEKVLWGMRLCKKGELWGDLGILSVKRLQIRLNLECESMGLAGKYYVDRAKRLE